MGRTAIAGLGAAGVLAFGLASTGQGFLNGDAAAYVAQGWAFDLTQRTTHLVYLLLASLLGSAAGPWLPWVLDLVSLGAAVGCVVLITRLARDPWVGCGGALASVVPWCAFAEVDLVWTALLLASLGAKTERRAAIWAALAVGTSPVALLVVPWICARRGTRSVAAGAGVAVVLLTLVTAGAWWWGPRGVLPGLILEPGRLAEAAIVGLPWALCVLWRPRAQVLWLLPLGLAPPDIPVWIWLAFVWSMEVEGGVWARRWAFAAALLSLGGLHQRATQVHREAVILGEVLSEMGPLDGLVAPWSWGVRASVMATGEPYALRWRTAGDSLLPMQEERWCAARPSKVVSLPPGANWAGAGEWDEGGVHWSIDPPMAGCPR